MNNILNPELNCSLCPRLLTFRDANKKKFPTYHNAPVPSYESLDPPQLLIVGLAPGLHGANCTGRPFTNDYAGDLLYATLVKFGFAEGVYGSHAQDGLQLKGCKITNAVRCVPPENKPLPMEIKTCNQFLKNELANIEKYKAILALGTIAHNAILSALELRKASFRFAHGAVHPLNLQLRLFNSYHCSRYNTNTGRLTEPMFHQVFQNIKEYLSS